MMPSAKYKASAKFSLGVPSQQLPELINRQLSAAQDGAQRPGLDWCGAVQEDGGAARKIVSVPKQHMGPALTEGDETGFFERANQSVARDLREVAHAATSTSRNNTSSGGIAWRSETRPSR